MIFFALDCQGIERFTIHTPIFTHFRSHKSRNRVKKDSPIRVERVIFGKAVENRCPR